LSGKQAGGLERAWRLVESRHAGSPDAIVADKLDVVLPSGAVMVGVDTSDERHLLIPIDEHSAVRASVSGRWVRLAKRQLVVEGQLRTFADLSCSRPDLYDEFTVLAAEVVDAVAADVSRPVDAVNAVLSDWRELLRALASGRLDRGAVIGLYAELAVLEWVVHLDPRRRIDCWTGPTGGRHDFQRRAVALEVKGSTARRGRPVIVHGLDQLEAPPEATLYLAWNRLEVGVDRGDSLHDIVGRLSNVVVDPIDFEHRLREIGYDLDFDDVHARPLFTVLETRFYRVDGDFPRLTRTNLVGGDVPRGVVAVTYEIDLTGDVPAVLPDHEVEAVLSALAGTT
jgi:hypothetical protein